MLKWYTKRWTYRRHLLSWSAKKYGVQHNNPIRLYCSVHNGCCVVTVFFYESITKILCAFVFLCVSFVLCQRYNNGYAHWNTEKRLVLCDAYEIVTTQQILSFVLCINYQQIRANSVWWWIWSNRTNFIVKLLIQNQLGYLCRSFAIETRTGTQRLVCCSNFVCFALHCNSLLSN